MHACGSVGVGLHSVAATRPRGVGTGQRCQGQERGHPIVTDTMIDGLHTGAENCFQAVRSCVHSLTEAGFVDPSWTSLAESEEVMIATEAEPHEPQQSRSGA